MSPLFLHSQTVEFIGERDDIITSQKDIDHQKKDLIQYIKKLIKGKDNNTLSFLLAKKLKIVKSFLEYPYSGKIFMSKTIIQEQNLKETTVKLWIIGKNLSAKIYFSFIKKENKWTIKEINITYI